MEYKSKYKTSIQLQTARQDLIIDICLTTFQYKILQIKDGKLKLRRNKQGRMIKNSFVPFKFYSEAREHALKQINKIP